MNSNIKLAVLIPAFKIKYLNDLIACLMNQTLRPSKVFLSDDTPEGCFQQILAKQENLKISESLNINVIEGPRRGGRENLVSLHRVASLEDYDFYHIFLDDDIIFPTFYEKHVSALRTSSSVCSVSQRAYCTEDKIPFYFGRIPEEILRSDQKRLQLSHKFLVDSIVKRANNWLGEVSHFIFTRDFFVDEHNTLYAGDLINIGLEDVSMILNASRTSPIMYLNECLGFFRQSGQNNTRRRDFTFACGIWCWVVIAIDCWKSGFFAFEDLKQIYEFARNTFKRQFEGVPMSEMSQALLNVQPDKSTDQQFVKDFGDVWAAFVDGKRL